MLSFSRKVAYAGEAREIVLEEELTGIVFGGGKYRCPGKYFAFTEISLFLALVCSKVDVKIINESSSEDSGIPPIDYSTLVGLKRPDKSCLVHITRR